MGQCKVARRSVRKRKISDFPRELWATNSAAGNLSGKNSRIMSGNATNPQTTTRIGITNGAWCTDVDFGHGMDSNDHKRHLRTWERCTANVRFRVQSRQLSAQAAGDFFSLFADRYGSLISSRRQFPHRPSSWLR